MVAVLGFCRCVRVFCGLKLVLFSYPYFGGVFFWVCVGVLWGNQQVEIVPFLSQKG